MMLKILKDLYSLGNEEKNQEIKKIVNTKLNELLKDLKN